MKMSQAQNELGELLQSSPDLGGFIGNQIQQRRRRSKR